MLGDFAKMTRNFVKTDIPRGYAIKGGDLNSIRCIDGQALIFYKLSHFAEGQLHSIIFSI